jgi:hypothetical protein
VKRNSYGYVAPGYGTSSRRSSVELPIGLILFVFVIACFLVVYAAGKLAGLVFDVSHPMLFLHSLLLQSGLGK